MNLLVSFMFQVTKVAKKLKATKAQQVNKFSFIMHDYLDWSFIYVSYSMVG